MNFCGIVPQPDLRYAVVYPMISKEVSLPLVLVGGVVGVGDTIVTSVSDRRGGNAMDPCTSVPR